MSVSSVSTVPAPQGPPKTPSLDDTDSPTKVQSQPKAQAFEHKAPSFQSEETQATGGHHPHRGQQVDMSA